MKTALTATPDRLYRPDIDGVRAIAILSVLCYHGGLPWISGGFTGVDIFFVISGYLIGGHIYSEVRAGSFSFLRFYQRRAKRILPAFYGVLAFVLPAALILMSPYELSVLGRTACAATLSASNIVFWRISGYFANQSELNPLLMTWSLGVEEQFYAVIPLLMVFLGCIRRSLLLPAALLVCALSFLLACLALASHPDAVFFLLPTRAWELGAGVVLAIVELNRKRFALAAPLTQLLSIAGLALMLAPVFLLNARSPFPGLAALPSVLGTALVIAVPASWINRRILSLPPLVFVGRISYSLYLWHWPFLSYLRLISGGTLTPAAAGLGIACAFAAAILSYYWIEQPFRKSTRAPGPLLLRYGIVSFLILVACIFVGRGSGADQRFPELAQVDRAATARLQTDPCLATHAVWPLPVPCYDAQDARPSVALWGDSNSAALAPGLRDIAASQGYGFVQLGRAGCLPLLGAANYRPDNPPGTGKCIRFNRSALNYLRNDPRVILVVLVGQWTDSFQFTQKLPDIWLIPDSAREDGILPPETVKKVFQSALTNAIQSLQQSGKQVIVMTYPVFDLDPVLIVRTAQIPARHALAKWMGFTSAIDTGFTPSGRTAASVSAYAALKTACDSLRGVQLIDLRQELCRNGNQCAYRLGDRILYADMHHLTADGAHYALRDFHFPAIAAFGK